MSSISTRHFLQSAGILLAGLVLAACGKQEPPAPAASASAPAAAAPAPAADAPKAPAVKRVRKAAAPGTPDAKGE